jgi:LPXTG-motif cell wall-anchored protein
VQLVTMARKRAATASVAAIVAGTAAATLGVGATPALAEASPHLSCSAEALGGGTPFDVPVTVTGTISGSDHHPGDKVTLGGVSATATLSSDLVTALGAALPAGATDIQISGAYHIHVTGGSDGLDVPTGEESFDLAMNGGPLTAGQLGSETKSGTTQYDVGPADSSFFVVLDGFDATVELSGTVPAPAEGGEAQPVQTSLEVSCTPADENVVIDLVDVTEKKTTPPPNTGPGSKNPGGKDDKDTNNSGNNNPGNSNNSTNNTGTNSTGNNSNTQGRGNLANTGASNVVPMTATGGALVLLGAGLLFFMRRRRTATAPATEAATDTES